jgi:GPH family glycoside/pentoside/hexuronide:cation symporter
MTQPQIPPSQATASPEPLGWLRIWLYGIGEIPITASMVLFGLFLLFFYNTVMGLPAPLVGLAAAAGLGLDAVIDPLIGYQSDRSRHRLGRRRSYMLLGACTMGVCFAMIFFPPHVLAMGHGLFRWLLCCSILFRITTAIYRIPYLSLGAELTQDYDRRTVVNAVRSVCGLVGALLAAALSFELFFRAGTNGIDPKLQYLNYPKMGLAFGALLTATGLIAFFGTSGHRDPGGRNGTLHMLGFFRGFHLAVSNRAFRSIWLSFTAFYTAVILNASLAVYFFTWCAQVHDSRVLSAVQGAFGVGACIGIVLWLALAGRGEKRTCYVAGILGTAVMLGAATFLIGPGKPLGVGQAWPLIAGYTLAGIFASALWVLPASMLADVVDQDELVSGWRREGVFFGMLNFGEKVASGVAVLLAGLVLQYFVRLAPGSAVQSPVAVNHLAILYGLVPGLTLLASIVLISPYNLSRTTTLSIQRTLATRISLDRIHD